MKKLDRYIARAYILRFMMAYLVIFGLYVSFDLMQRIDMFQEAGAGRTLPQLFVLYVYQLLTNAIDTVPPLLMLAGGLVFIHIGRNGELLTLKASGISLRRVALPILLITVPVIGLLALAQEMVIPGFYRQRNLLENVMDERVAGPFLLTDARFGYSLSVGSYDFTRERMSHVALMLPYPDSQISEQILEADSARWLDDSTLLFERVSILHFGPDGRLQGEAQAYESRTWATSLTVDHFLDAQNDDIMASAPSMTLEDLRLRIQESPHNPRFRVLFHSRIADKLVPFALLMIGIPMLVTPTRSHHSRLVGALVVILITGIYYVLTFIAISVGNSGAISPVVAAWMMPSAGMLTGLAAFARMRT